MNKINKYCQFAVMAMMGTALVTSCDNSKDSFDYNVYPGQVGLDVYFPANAQTQFDMNTAGGSFSITIMRSDNSGELTVPISVVSASNDNVTSALSFPASVNFSAGSYSADYVVNYESMEQSGIGFDVFQVYHLSISDEMKTPFGSGSTELEIRAVYPSPWEVLGEATYTDYFVGTFFGVDDVSYKLEISENQLNPGLYRLLNPYGEAYPYNDPGDWDTSQDYYMYINAMDPDKVFLSDNAGNPTFFYSGMNWGYGEFIMTTFASYYLRSGNEAAAAPYYGTLTDGIIYLPGSSTLCAMMEYNDGGLYSRSFNGPAQWIVLPGVTVADTSIDVTYNGLLTKPDETLEVVAYVKLGADVASAKVAVVAGSNPSSAVIEAIESGSIESVAISTSGTVNIPFDVTNETGKYSVVAVSYADGEAKEYAYESFNYTAGVPETWSLVGTGLYTYLPFWEEALELEPEVLELYESDTTPGKFKITHWLNDQDFKFTVEEDGTIVVDEEQPTGVTAGGNPIWVDDLTFWGLDQPGYLDEGIYYFSVIYYNSVSGSIYDYGYETFEPSTENAASYSTRSSRSLIEKGKPMKVATKSVLKSNLSKKGLSFQPTFYR